MAIQAWSTTAGSNTSVDGVSIAEGWSPADVNNAIRGLMSDVAEWKALIEASITSGGSSNAYTLTTGTSRASYAEPMMIAFRANHTNTGAATIALDSLSAKDLKRCDGTALIAGDIVENGLYIGAYQDGLDDVLLFNVAPTTVTASSTTTLTNKTIDGDDNTVQDLPYSAIKSTSRTGSDAKLVTGTAGATDKLAKWDANGDVIEGPTTSTGPVVGTTDTQTLTNKTITAAVMSGTWTASGTVTMPALTYGGEQNLADQVLKRAEFKDYSESIQALGGGGGTLTFDFENGNVATLTVSVAATTLAFSNWPATGKMAQFMLIITNGASQTFNYPAAARFPGGEPPTLQSSGTDILVGFSIDAGTTIYFMPAGLAMAV
jgi:hypothetical protein